MRRLSDYLRDDPDKDIMAVLLMELTDRACSRHCGAGYCATVGMLETVLDGLLPEKDE